MKLDLRYPIGLLFSILGLLLFFFGLVSNPEIYKSSLGVDINLWWGLVLIAFGGMMLILVYRSRKG